MTILTQFSPTDSAADVRATLNKLLTDILALQAGGSTAPIGWSDTSTWNDNAIWSDTA